MSLSASRFSVRAQANQGWVPMVDDHGIDRLSWSIMYSQERIYVHPYSYGYYLLWPYILYNSIWPDVLMLNKNLFKLSLYIMFRKFRLNVLCFYINVPCRHAKSNHTVWVAWTVGGWDSLCTALKSSQRQREGLCSESLWVLPLWLSLAGLLG